MMCTFMLEEIDIDGVEPLGLPIGKIELCLGIREIGDQGLSRAALNAKGLVVLIDEITAVFRNL